MVNWADPEIVGGIVGSVVGGTLAAAGFVTKNVLKANRNARSMHDVRALPAGNHSGNGHCPEHTELVAHVVETRNDVKWLKKKNETDDTKAILTQVLFEVKRRK